MSVVALQRGHCFRDSGVTGTHREQEFAGKVGAATARLLLARGHTVHLLTADEPVPPCRVFVALHTDGSSNKARRGASVGYPDSNGGRLAAAWKRAHQRAGYAAGFLPDNYTDGLRYYYGFRKANAEFEFLAEHGFTTNALDEAWLFANIDRCAMAHVEAIGELVGHPNDVPLTAATILETQTMQLIRNATAGSASYEKIALLGGPRKPFEILNNPEDAGSLSAALGKARDVNAREFDVVAHVLNVGPR